MPPKRLADRGPARDVPERDGPSEVARGERSAVRAERDALDVAVVPEWLADRGQLSDVPEDDCVIVAAYGENCIIGAECKGGSKGLTVRQVCSGSGIAQGREQASPYLGRQASLRFGSVGHSNGLKAQEKRSIRTSLLTTGLRNKLACEGHVPLLDRALPFHLCLLERVHRLVPCPVGLLPLEGRHGGEHQKDARRDDGGPRHPSAKALPSFSLANLEGDARVQERPLVLVE